MEPVYVRSGIIEKAKAGKWTPDRAEAVAQRLAVGPLAADPHRDDFDADFTKRDFWPIPMALAWIAWRSADRVLAAWPEYQAERKAWTDISNYDDDGQLIGLERWDISAGRPLLVVDMIMDQDDDYPSGQMQETVLASWERLRGMLGRGELKATGLRRDQPGRAPAIDPSEWQYVDWRLDLRSDANLTPPFERVFVESAPLLQAFPSLADLAPVSGAPGRPTSMHLIETEFRQRFASGVSLPSMVAEAELLEAWHKHANPGMPPAKAKTIRNNLMKVSRELKAARN